jgi:hypothetical protein
MKQATPPARISPRVIHHLLFGGDKVQLDPALPSPLPQDLVDAAWLTIGDALTAVWITGGAVPGMPRAFEPLPPRPCSRPFSWWVYEGPDHRQVISGTTTEHDGFRFRPHEDDGPRMEFGLPSPRWGDAEYESEATYLDRHGLLRPEERAALRAQDLAQTSPST